MGTRGRAWGEESLFVKSPPGVAPAAVFAFFDGGIHRVGYRAEATGKRVHCSSSMYARQRGSASHMHTEPW